MMKTRKANADPCVECLVNQRAENSTETQAESDQSKTQGKPQESPRPIHKEI